MTELEKRVRSFCKSSSSVIHNETIISKITRSDIVELNKVIEPKINQNKIEKRRNHMLYLEDS